MRGELREAAELIPLQIELVKLQRSLTEGGAKLLAIFEGRDAAGNDGTIKRFVEHMVVEYPGGKPGNGLLAP